jgi:hypothetical protein
MEGSPFFNPCWGVLLPNGVFNHDNSHEDHRQRKANEVGDLWGI